MVMPVLLGLYFCVYDSEPMERYERQSPFMRGVAAFAAYLKSWIKRWVLQPVDQWISSFNTSTHRTASTPMSPKRNDKGRFIRTLCIFMTVFQANAELPIAAHKSIFDTDSNELYIDNCATACITNNPNDCHTPPHRIQRRIKGIGGTFEAEVYETTIRWDLEDDDGVTETHIIPRSFYIPNAPHHLFSPQHWAQHQRNTSNKARCITYDQSIVLEWENRAKSKTIPLDIRGSNVGIMRTSPGFQAFSAFCQSTGRTTTDDDNKPITVFSHMIEDTDSIAFEPNAAPDTDFDDEHT